jgi:glycosyltransferase involved in cell wall biosynthesis
MRILHLLAYTPIKLGSIERWSMRLVQVGRERGHEVLLGFSRLPESAEYLAALEKARVQLLVDCPRSRVDIGFLRRLITFIKLERIDVVHTHFSPTCHFGNLAAWLVGAPGRFWQIHSMSGLGRRLLSSQGHIAAQRLSARLVLRTLCVSEAIREEFAQLGLPNEKLCVLPLGIDVERFCLHRDPGVRTRIRASFRVPANTPLVGTVSRAEPVKGLPHLVEAAARVAVVRPDVRWLVVGGGSQMQQLQGLAKALGVVDRIVFEGVREDIPDLLQAMDIFVLPSLSEGLPLAALEAMASGRPVVCSRVGGLAELVSHEETGLLVPPGDSTALAEGVLRLLSDSTLGHRLADLARGEAITRYDHRVFIEQLFDVYEQTVPASMVRDHGPNRLRM